MNKKLKVTVSQEYENCYKYDFAHWDDFLEVQALQAKLTPTQTRVFLTRFAQDNWLKRIEDIWELSDVNSFESFVKHSTNIYKIFKSNCPEISKGAGNFAILRDWLLQEFQLVDKQNYIAVSEQIYIERSPIESECYQTILQPGALIRIKAPSKMGKTSLLNHILDYSDTQNYRTVHINLLQIERDKFSSLDKLLRWFCICISDALGLDFQLDKFWNEDRGSMLSCTRYLEILLEDKDTPLVLGLDEVDRLFQYPDISQDFFYLLRSWHEEANNIDLWEKLRLIIVYSTEDFGKLDINQSPFNVGLPIDLKPFNLEQVQSLINLQGLVWSDIEIDKLMEMVGGHPYLIYLAISQALNQQESLTDILQKAPTDVGIYNSHLRENLINLRSNKELELAFSQIVNSAEAIQIDTFLAYQLYRMGLIKWMDRGNFVLPSCQLYQLYFSQRLK